MTNIQCTNSKNRIIKKNISVSTSTSLVKKAILYMARSTNNDEDISTMMNDNTQTSINEDEEEKHFRKIIGAFLYYR